MEEFRAGQKPIIVAPVHRDGRDFAYAIREEIKGEGMLGREDREIARLESCNLSEAQKADPINYEVGQVVECHHRLKGDLRPGEQWEVTQVLPEAVVVTRNGREKLLPLAQSKGFNVYYRDAMPIAVGERAGKAVEVKHVSAAAAPAGQAMATRPPRGTVGSVFQAKVEHRFLARSAVEHFHLAPDRRGWVS